MPLFKDFTLKGIPAVVWKAENKAAKRRTVGLGNKSCKALYVYKVPVVQKLTEIAGITVKKNRA